MVYLCSHLADAYDYIKIKDFCLVKNTLDQVYKQEAERVKMSTMSITNNY